MRDTLDLFKRLMMSRSILVTVVLSGATLGVAPKLMAASGFQETDLLSDDGAIAGTTPDANLINPWGLTNLPGGPWWIANNNSGTTEIFTGTGTKLGSTIAIPASSSTNGPAPTGAVGNTSSQFMLKDGSKALFIFDGEDGTIAGWNTGDGTAAEQPVNNGTASV